MKRRKAFKIITSVLGYGLIAALIGCIAYVMIAKAKGRITFIGGKATLWVISDSMEPEIPQKSFILVEKAEAKDVKEGDVIVFISDDPAIQGKYNTHRVVRASDEVDGFVTKGDNNLSEDHYPARAENVVGKYVKNLDFLSRVGRFLSSGTGIAMSVTLILVIAMVMYMPELKRLKRDQDKEIEKAHQEQIDKLVALEVEKLKREYGLSASSPESAPEAPEGDKNEESCCDKKQPEVD